MPTPEVWFAIPSASPEQCRKTLPEWRRMGYRIAVLQNWKKGDIPADIVVWRDQYPGWPGSINELCRSVVPKDAAIVVSGGDDMLPDPRHPAPQLAMQFLERFPDTFGVMQPQGDGFMEAAHYCGSPWLGRAWIDRMYGGTGPMPSMYRHNWSDVELFWVAKGMGCLWQRPDLSQYHDHFYRRRTERPDYWEQNVHSADRDDVQMFLARRWLNFPGHEPKGPAPKFDPSVLRHDVKRLAERHWVNLYASDLLDSSWSDRMRSALDRCAMQGRTRVALYGAGTHTRALGSVLREPPVQIVCIIDDDPGTHGQKLWNFPIVSREDALRMHVDAVVLSSNSLEDKLWENAARFRANSIPVIRLYEDGGLIWHDDTERRVRRALERIAPGRAAALYGAGTHTQRVSGVLADPRRPVDCVIDDDPQRQGTELWGVPVVSRASALARGVRAIILSSDRFEAQMWDATADLRAQGIEVIRLYPPATATSPTPTCSSANAA